MLGVGNFSMALLLFHNSICIVIALIEEKSRTNLSNPPKKKFFVVKTSGKTASKGK
jgi:hypothetical protein